MKPKITLVIVTSGNGYDRSPCAVMVGDIPPEAREQIKKLEADVGTAREQWIIFDNLSKNGEKISLELYTDYISRREKLQEYLLKTGAEYINLSDLDTINLY
jgi:hypothetical protein